jgi:Uncharacterised nucleotidyltransferase
MKTDPMALAAADNLSAAEWRLLLGCARTRIQPGMDARLVESARHGIDARKLIDAALRHGIAPLLHATLRGLNSPGIPELVLDELGGHVRTNLQRNLFLTKQLLGVVRAFRANGIPVLALKGPALAYLAYGDLGLRRFNDLDILVHEPDVPAAEQVLLSLGFEMKMRDGAQSVEGYHSGFISKDGNAWVELHWRLEFIDDRHLKSLWKRSEPVSMFGVPVEAFCPVDQLVFACQHGAKHRWVRLSWLADVCALIDRDPKPDWPAIFTRAREMNLQRSLAMGLVLAVRLFGIALPTALANRLETDRMAKGMAAEVCDYIFRDTQPAEEYHDHWGYRIQLLDRFPDRFRLRWRYLDGAIWTKGRKRSPIYVVPRMVQIAWKYCRRPRFVKNFFHNVFGR